MGVKKYTEKLNDYFGRLENKTAPKIKKDHVDKVLRKLEAKRRQLQDEKTATAKASKINRLETKLKVVDEQIKRANWLLEEIE